jgi:hypothetical protein
MDAGRRIRTEKIMLRKDLHVKPDRNLYSPGSLIAFSSTVVYAEK